MFYSHISARRLVSLPVCFVLSLVLIFGSVSSFSSSSLTLLTKAFADDMMGEGGGQEMPSSQEAPATTDAITDAPSGHDGGDDDDDNDDSSNDMPKDAPVTTGTLTAGEDSDNDDDDDSGRDNDDDDDDNDDNEPTSKDAPATTDALAAKKIECPKGQEVTLFSTSCEAASGADSTSSAAPKKYEPPAVLSYQGNEVELIESYANPDPSVIKSTVKQGRNTFTTFKDQTVKTTTSEIDIIHDKHIEHTKIVPGPGSPLDKLKVVQVDLPSTVSYHDGPKHPDTPPNVRETEGDQFLHKVSYKDGTAIVASRGYEDDYTRKYYDIEWIEVYDPQQKISSSIEIDPEERMTVVENMHDHSETFYPEKGNAYTVYPPAADGTQKTVTVTSEGQPVVTVRDANGNIIPPKE